jgi:hypothetical protein
VGRIYDHYCAPSGTTGQGSGNTGLGLEPLTLSFMQKLQEAGNTAAPSGSTGPVFIFSRRGSTGSTGPLPLNFKRVQRAEPLQPVEARYRSGTTGGPFALCRNSWSGSTGCTDCLRSTTGHLDFAASQRWSELPVHYRLAKMALLQVNFAKR